MPARTGKCINFGGCNKADSQEVVTIPDGAEFVCPDCEKALVAMGGGGGRSGGPGTGKLKFILAAVLGLGVIGTIIAWLVKGGSPDIQNFAVEPTDRCRADGYFEVVRRARLGCVHRSRSRPGADGRYFARVTAGDDNLHLDCQIGQPCGDPGRHPAGDRCGAPATILRAAGHRQLHRHSERRPCRTNLRTAMVNAKHQECLGIEHDRGCIAIVGISIEVLRGGRTCRWPGRVVDLDLNPFYAHRPLGRQGWFYGEERRPV